MKNVLLIAGSDPSAGAGIQQDLKVVTLLGSYGLTVITALTIQNTTGVRAVHPVDPELVAAQLEAILQDIQVDAVKLGMLATEEIVRVVADKLQKYPIPLVVLDPVLAASDGAPLLSEAGLEVMKQELFPLATVVTPNLAEASRLAGSAVGTLEEMEAAARLIQEMGPSQVLIKGGHLPDAPIDLFYDGKNTYQLPGVRLMQSHTHGTGCALASALATLLAQGRALPEALTQARELVAQAICYGLPLGQGRGPINPYASWARELDRYRVLQELRTAAARLTRGGVEALIPEVQSNLGYATVFPRGPQDVAAFPGRIIHSPHGLIISRAPEFGASRHIASVILTVGRSHPGLRSALNIRYFPEVERLAPLLHWRVASFDRGQEPPELQAQEGGNLSEGIASVLQPGEPPPDLIFDRGGWGKEPMIRVLGADPMHVVEKVLALHQAFIAASVI